MKFLVNAAALSFFLVVVICIPVANALDSVQIFTLTSRSEPEIRNEFQALKEAGVHTLIFRCFKNPGDTPFHVIPETTASGVYFPSETEPVAAPLLPLIVRHAHALDMQCYGWITTRKSMWILDEKPEWEGSRIAVLTGEAVGSGQLDIFLDAVQERLMHMLLAIAETGVDGILIQDDFVSRQGDDLDSRVWELFSGHRYQSSDFNRLFSIENKQAHYTPQYYKWAFFKSRQLTQVLERIIQPVKSAHPDLKIAVNLYYETVTAPGKARLWLAQDLELLLDTPVDQFAVMAYQHQMASELGITPVSATSRLLNSRLRCISGHLIPRERILWKYQSMDWQTKEAVPTSILDCITEAIDGSPIVMVPYRNLDMFNKATGRSVK
jgi:uncharacterized lipoprotein YddW (UPF0748 family)